MMKMWKIGIFLFGASVLFVHAGLLSKHGGQLSEDEYVNKKGSF